MTAGSVPTLSSCLRNTLAFASLRNTLALVSLRNTLAFASLCCILAFAFLCYTLAPRVRANPRSTGRGAQTTQGYSQFGARYAATWIRLQGAVE